MRKERTINAASLVLIAVVILLALAVAGALAYQRLHAQSAPVVAEPPAVKSGPREALIGHSVEGRDIRAYAYGAGAKKILFVGGIHGGYEWNSVALAYQLIDYLDAHADAIPASESVIIIPDLNPDAVYKIVGKEGRFALSDVPAGDRSSGRFNAHGVDLNRNFDCKWAPEGTWKGKTVSGGSAAFSEPEAAALRNFVSSLRPEGVVFWHSQANAVYASECTGDILPKTLDIMNAYSQASQYQAIKTFDAYEVHGDAEGWLASIGIPAISVELSTHESVEWEQNLAGVEALLRFFDGGQK